MGDTSKSGSNTMNFSVGAGFRPMESVRTELVVSYLHTPEYSTPKSITSSGFVGYFNV